MEKSLQSRCSHIDYEQEWITDEDNFTWICCSHCGSKL